MLNFDPHRWIAERGNPAPLPSVASVAAVASDVSDIEKSDSGERPATFATTATLRGWHECIGRLDPYQPPDGFSIMWWQQACDDARWIYENFAARAVRDGWSAHDLFGILPWRLGSGGICDRLRGARNLKMDGDRAVWSHCGVRDQFVRGGGDDLVDVGLRPIWSTTP